PLEAMLEAGRYFLNKQGKSPGVPEEELIKVAVKSMGLDDVSEFDPEKKIIEYQFEERLGPLAKMTIQRFANELSMETPTPGGGSVAALAGALAAALTSMVANLTVGKKEYLEVTEPMKEIALKAQRLKDELLRDVDKDTQAFNKVMAAFGLPKTTDEQIQQRNRAIQEATRGAALVPLEVMKKSLEVLELSQQVAQKGNVNALSDAGVSALMARTAAEGASFNVRINLKSIEEKNFVEQLSTEAAQLLSLAKIAERKVLDIVESKLAANSNQ
ncbi:MAG: cyclodeaminase/cyclohydrolase family protein, partial [candidate division KSB1 bacterium]|nr:cyclodeaminase/cyclohydrolase family protein [candidate division KSB1 bacterium]